MNSQTSIKSIYGPNGELDEAFTNQAVTLTLQDELDISRGDIILTQDNKEITLHPHFFEGEEINKEKD